MFIFVVIVTPSAQEYSFNNIDPRAANRRSILYTVWYSGAITLNLRFYAV